MYKKYKSFLLVLISFIYPANKLFSVNTLAIDASKSITGNMSVGGTLGSTGSFSTNTNKVTVDAATGNTVVAGIVSLPIGITYTSLRVTGSMSLLGTFAENQNKMTIGAAGDTTMAGTLKVSGVSTTGDLRVTGSTNLLGKLATNQNNMTVDATGNTTFGGTLGVSGLSTLKNDLRVTGSTCLLGKLSVNQTKMTVDSVGNTVVGGTLDVNGSLGSGWHHIFGDKLLTTIGTSATTVLNITFANLAGASSPLFKGARIRLYMIISGSVTLIVLPANTLIYYLGDLIISPGATSGAACTLTAVSETTTLVTGNLTTLTSSVAGTGVSATLRFASLFAINSSSVALFYDIISDNLASVS